MVLGHKDITISLISCSKLKLHFVGTSVVAVHLGLHKFTVIFFYLIQRQTKVWQNFTAIEKDFMEPLRQALKVTRIQYQAELANKRDEMAGNKSKNVLLND